MSLARRDGVLGQNGRMDLGLRGRVYLVTGGSRGLGFAAAQALTAEGARVVLSAPHEATAAAATARLAHNGAAADAVTWVVADNADPATPDLLIAAARNRFGRLDGALISVGGSPPGTVATTTDDAWRSAFESVFLGAVRLARALAADLDGHAAPGSLAPVLMVIQEHEAELHIVLSDGTRNVVIKLLDSSKGIKTLRARKTPEARSRRAIHG